MTEVDKQRFKTMDRCHICGKKYTYKDVRVRDHCHITGKFRGSAHPKCNLKLRIKPENLKIPIIFHNLRGYDSHFIMQQIGEIANKHGYTNKKGEKQDLNINAIPNNMEKYMAFMLGNHLTFIDSFQFMSPSLDKLVSNLPKDDLIYTSEAFKGKRLDLMSQKGVYPYDFMDSFEKFNLRELPNKDQFYSILNDQQITDDEFEHAKKVWDTFYFKTMGEYHDLYLVSDVLLLIDVFENFRKTCMQYYKLDPLKYFTSPGLSWDAMLKTGLYPYGGGNMRSSLTLLRETLSHFPVLGGGLGLIRFVRSCVTSSLNESLSSKSSWLLTSFNSNLINCPLVSFLRS